MKIINISGVPMAGKSTTGKILSDRLNKSGENTIFIEVDDLISKSEKQGKTQEEIVAIKKTRLLEQLKHYKKTKDYSVVVFAWLMDDELSKDCKRICENNDGFISISLVPSLETLISKRGERTPTPEIVNLITKMYTEWNFDKPKTADLIIDNTKMTPEQSTEKIISFIKSKKKSFENASDKVKNKNIIYRIKHSLFQKN